MRFFRPRNMMLVVAVSVLSGCGGGGGSTTAPNTTTNNNPPPPAGTPNSVVVTNNVFTPGALSTTVGATVTWTWDSCSGSDGYGGQSCVAHEIVFDDGPTSGQKSSGTYDRTFATAGTYPYHCRIHGAAMSGSVVVK
jgi:Plastocyanin